MNNSNFRAAIKKLQEQFKQTEEAWSRARQSFKYRADFTSFHGLCKDLVGKLYRWVNAAETGKIKRQLDTHYASANDLISRARTALGETSQQQPELTDDQIDEWWDQVTGYYALYEEAQKFARFVLARCSPPPRELSDDELLEFAWEHGSGFYNCDCQEEANILARSHVATYRKLLALSNHTKTNEDQDSSCKGT